MMNNLTKIGENICRLTVAFRDIYTTVYLVKTEKGDLLFDAASNAEDVQEYILPFLKEQDVTPQTLKYVFISHHHGDHAGGLNRLLESFPDTCIVSFHQQTGEEYPGRRWLLPQEGQLLLDEIEVVGIPGHTPDSGAVLDRRSGTLISGDSLQLYGIFGSGTWGAAIRFPREHRMAIEKLRTLRLQRILTAHDYHPLGYCYEGEQMISKALDACLAPLAQIEDLIRQNPGLSDAQICKKYHAREKLPTLAEGVVAALRKTLS